MINVVRRRDQVGKITELGGDEIICPQDENLYEIAFRN
jgi:hypothetical protein